MLGPSYKTRPRLKDANAPAEAEALVAVRICVLLKAPQLSSSSKSDLGTSA